MSRSTTPPLQGTLTDNRLLRQLAEHERARLVARTEIVELSAGQQLFTGEGMDFAFFPLSGVVAKWIHMANGDQVEAGLIGNEGMAPLCLFLGLWPTPLRATVQCPGQAARLSVADFEALVKPGRSLHTILMRYSAAFMGQLALSAACKQLHPLRAQFCRWLLMHSDRMASPHLTLTQSMAAENLGVRRMSITAVASQLQKEGLIAYSRGRLTIVEPRKLRRASCECYEKMLAISDSLLGDNPANAR